MPDQPCTDNLDIIVNRMLVQAPHEEFKKYWELYKKTAYISDPKGIYFRISQDATYRNIVIAEAVLWTSRLTKIISMTEIFLSALTVLSQR